MLKIKRYGNLKQALNNIIPEDNENFIIIRHNLSKGEGVKEHLHPNADEWIIFDKGKFQVSLDSVKQEVNTLSESGTRVIHFPKNHPHDFKCLEDISYFVLRSGKDETIYVIKE